MLFQQAMASMSTLVLPVVAPEMSVDTGMPASLIGAYWMFIFGIGFFASLGCGGYIQRFGPLRVSQLALVCMGAGLLVSATGSPWLIAASCLPLGVGAAISTPCSTAILAKITTPRHAPLIFSLKQTGVPVGGMLAGLLVPFFALRFGWQGAFLGCGGICLVYAVLLQPLRSVYDDDRAPAKGFDFNSIFVLLKSILTTPKYRQLAFTWWAYVGVQAIFGTFFVTYLVQELDHDLALAGLIFAGAQVASVVARVVWGWLCSRFISPQLMLAILGVIIVGSALTTGAITDDWSIVSVALVAVVYSASAVSFHGVAIAEIVRVLPTDEVSAKAGGILSFAMLGMMSYPALFGIILQVTESYAIGFWASAVPALIVCVNLFRRVHKG
ncbi:MAG: MFS transporter [Rhodospirillaceae bacterium]|nr:MFS transporter [Rhodospirillaceae bacterium]